MGMESAVHKMRCPLNNCNYISIYLLKMLFMGKPYTLYE